MSRWALVTGSARRIGRAIALELAAQGWNLILHYNRSGEEAAALAETIIQSGQQAVLAEVDLARLDAVARLIPALNAELGIISALINNASLFELDDKDPDGSLHRAINAEAPRLLSESLYRQIPLGEVGSIVNILDGTVPEKNLNAYSASKNALKAATLASAKDFAPRVRVNGVAPGPTLPNIRQSERHFEAQIETTPLKVGIQPEDIARAVCFLVASPAITGEILHVDGGKHLEMPDSF